MEVNAVFLGHWIFCICLIISFAHGEALSAEEEATAAGVLGGERGRTAAVAWGEEGAEEVEVQHIRFIIAP